MDEDLTSTVEYDATQEILGLVNQTKSLPVGFIGSGFSRRYLGTPDWKGLLDYLASLTGEPLNRFLVSRSGNPQDSYPETATAIAHTFRDIWWNDDKYAEQRERFGDQIMDIEDPLKLQVSLYIQEFDVIDDDFARRELEAFRDARFQSFLTTNFDNLIEQYRSDYVPYTSQHQALFSPMYEIGEIYKIHGTVTDFPSLVLTRADYEAYEKRNPYLTAKMLTLFVENPVLFFGYSLGDPHVQRLLATLTECLTDEQLNTLNERLIFIGRVSDKRPPTLQRAPITVHGHTFYAYEVGLGDWEPLFTGLSEIPYHFAPRVLRRLRESVYLAARDANATTKVRVVDFEDDDDLNELEIVLGIGVMDKIAETGYTQVSISRYLHDMLHGKTELDAQRLAANTFKLFRQKFVPTFYVRRLAALQGTLEGVASQRQVQKWDQNNHDIRPYVTKEEEAALYGNFRNLLAAPIKEYRLHELPLWLKSWDVEDILALRDYLSSKLAERESPPTGIVKLCCLFDRLVYGGDFSGDTAELIGRLGLAPALFPHGGPSSS